jgi:hypothetical protein
VTDASTETLVAPSQWELAQALKRRLAELRKDGWSVQVVGHGTIPDGVTMTLSRERASR